MTDKAQALIGIDGDLNAANEALLKLSSITKTSMLTRVDMIIADTDIPETDLVRYYKLEEEIRKSVPGVVQIDKAGRVYPT